MVDFNTAINAYNQAAGAVNSAVAGKKPAATPSGDDESFATMVTDSLNQAVQSGRQAEELSLKQISGEADLKDVITAVANAEHTLETVVAVRDKVLSAYQEILRMPI
ncbi:MAG: flagellar hook-basal body complex protein FliE [Rhodospirillaceae bacterium]|nr:flagellar hook-basal body complex protein FliE [Rhodospirillaceae bacterium]